MIRWVLQKLNIKSYTLVSRLYMYVYLLFMAIGLYSAYTVID